MSISNPLVSICIPTYNGAKYIAEAMNSAISQTYRPLEIIVSDDKSQDNTIEIIKSFCNQTNIPICIYSHNPSTIGDNWNNCVVNSNGEYIKFLFQDDIIDIECVEELVKPTIENENVGLVFCKRKILFDVNRIDLIDWFHKYGKVHEAWTVLKNIQKGRLLLKDQNLLNSPINKIGEPTAVLLSRSVFVKVGFFNLNLKQNLDVEFWYRLMPFYNVAYVDKELATFRLHDEQATSINSKTNVNENFSFQKEIYKKLFWYLNNNNKKHLFITQNIFGRFVYNSILFIKSPLKKKNGR